MYPSFILTRLMDFSILLDDFARIAPINMMGVKPWLSEICILLAIDQICFTFDLYDNSGDNNISI